MDTKRSLPKKKNFFFFYPHSIHSQTTATASKTLIATAPHKKKFFCIKNANKSTEKDP